MYAAINPITSYIVGMIHADKVVVTIFGTTKTDRKRSDFIGIF
jgi:hypothetical protein